MNASLRLLKNRLHGRILLIPLVTGLAACATPGDVAPPVILVANQTNVVAYWNDIANKTVLASSSVNITPEEQRPTFFFDVASVHVASTTPWWPSRAATSPLR